MSEALQGVLIGYGNMGHVHEAAALANDARFAAIVDPDPALQAEPKVQPALSDLGAVKPDFVIISSPTPDHLDHVEAVVDAFGERGLLGILLEKPPVRTREELGWLRLLAQSFGHICIGEVEHYNPGFEAFTAYQGTPQHIRMERHVNLEHFLHGTRPWFLDEEKSGGIVLDMMIHDLNLLVAKYGLPKAISRVTGQKQKYGIHDNVQVVLDYEGFQAEVIGSWTAANDKPIVASIEITGDRDDHLSVLCDDYMDDHGDDTNPYFIQMKRFLASLETGELPVPLEAYLQATELALQIKQRLS